MTFIGTIISWIGSIGLHLLEWAMWVEDSFYIPNAIATILRWIVDALGKINAALWVLEDWGNLIMAAVGKILSIDDIYYAFESLFNKARNAWAWVQGAVSNVWSIIDNWWSSTWANVQSWVNSAIDIAGDVIDSIYGWVNDIKYSLYHLIGRIPSIDEITSWFSNWWGNILGWIQSLGYLPAGAIGDFINSTLSDWFPFYDTLSEWWSSVVDFITNPWDWLMDRIEYWFFDRPS